MHFIKIYVTEPNLNFIACFLECVDFGKIGLSTTTNISEEGEFYCLTVSFEASNKVLFYKVFYHAFVNEFKYKYLTNNISFTGITEEDKELLVRCLCFFDKEIDRKELFNELEKIEGKNIYLESFFKFRLKKIEDRLKEMLKLTNDNSLYFLSKETFLELVKFLIVAIRPEVELVRLEQNKTTTFYTESYEKILEKDFNSEVLLAVELVKLSPKKIQVCPKNFSENNLNYLKNLFENKIEITEKKFFKK